MVLGCGKLREGYWGGLGGGVIEWYGRREGVRECVFVEETLRENWDVEKRVLGRGCIGKFRMFLISLKLFDLYFGFWEVIFTFSECFVG